MPALHGTVESDDPLAVGDAAHTVAPAGTIYVREPYPVANPLRPSQPLSIHQDPRAVSGDTHSSRKHGHPGGRGLLPQSGRRHRPQQHPSTPHHLFSFRLPPHHNSRTPCLQQRKGPPPSMHAPMPPTTAPPHHSSATPPIAPQVAPPAATYQHLVSLAAVGPFQLLSSPRNHTRSGPPPVLALTCSTARVRPGRKPKRLSR